MDEPVVPALPRQLGSEVPSVTCPTCGQPMAVTMSPYGSYTANCPHCNPLQREAASTELPRELGTPVSIIEPTMTSPTEGALNA